MHSDYRIDQFTDTAAPLDIVGEVHMIPASSPYTIRLLEVPLLESPSSISVRVRDVLTAAITTVGQTTCTVMNGAWFANGDIITIDNEQMQVTNVATNTLTITRGYGGTAAATHLANIAVFGPAWAEVAATPSAKQFWPDYSTGAADDAEWNTGTSQFNSADAGKIVSITYRGTGTLASVNPAKNFPACYSELGDGSDGHFISSGSDTIDGLKQYKSFVVQAGHTVTVGANPLTILCQGAVLIAGTINGAGVAGGNFHASSNGTAAGGAGKGGGGVGSTVQNADGFSYTDPVGASGAGGGGNFSIYRGGGGFLEGAVIAPASAVSASLANLAARLLRHSAGGGGFSGYYISGGGSSVNNRGSGGGGGSVMLVGRRVVNTGTITVDGGALGAVTAGNVGGGGGGGASIRIVALIIKFTGTITVAGGAGGAGNSTGQSSAGGNGWSKVIEIGG